MLILYSCTLDMYFTPEPTIVCQCINIGSARPNKMNLLQVKVDIHVPEHVTSLVCS